MQTSNINSREKQAAGQQGHPDIFFLISSERDLTRFATA
jgi:hypothetical protein